MQRKTTLALSVVCALTTAACSDRPQTLLSASGVEPVATFVNADGSTLKVTAPKDLGPNGGTLDTRRPTLGFTNAVALFVNVNLSHQIDVEDGTGAVVYTRLLDPTATSSTHTLEEDLPYAQTFWFRARARDGDQFGPWSIYAMFRTPDPPPSSLGPGPRTPGDILPRATDPPPGQLLPLPGYGASVVGSVAAQYRGDLDDACHSRMFVFRVVHALRQFDSRWGVNYKRGHRGDMSTDIVTYNPTDRPDEGESQVYLIDIIGAICEGNNPTWVDATDKTWDAAGSSACGTYWCAMWTLEPYYAAGFTDAQ